jgi:hypothetical protein
MENIRVDVDGIKELQEGLLCCVKRERECDSNFDKS